MVYCLYRNEKDPYFNLAAEEYVLKEFQHDVFMIWRNEASVIVGKHQNTSREVNQAFCSANSIPVIRRITGGGTVYHDRGNINFSFVNTGEEGKLVNFKKYTEPVISFLKSFGLNAYFEGKNNIRVNGLKVSGNAAHVFKNRVLHHGTLLFDANLENLEQSISGNEDYYHDRSVRSIRSEVANLKDLISTRITAEDFEKQFFDHMLEYLAPSEEYSWCEDDIARINKIKRERYLEASWNYNYSPDYVFKNEFPFEGQNISIEIDVKKGIMENVSLSGGSSLKNHLDNIAILLKGARHDHNSIAGIIKSSTFASGKAENLAESILNNIF
jgi:lipoate-protein ligase A